MIIAAIALAVSGSLTFWPVKHGYDFYIPIVLLIAGYAAAFLLWLLACYICSRQYKIGKTYEKPSKFATWWLIQGEQFIAYHARVHVKVVGENKFPKDKRVLIVCNHRSNFDPMIISQFFGKKGIAFITKPQNCKIPLAGKYITGMCYMPIERSDPLQSLEVMKRSANYIDEDKCSIGVFPEGKRQTQEVLSPDFHEGVFNIALRTKAPIVVMTVFDAHNIPKNFPKRKTNVTLEILNVIDPSEYEGMTAKAVSDIVRQMMWEDISKKMQAKTR